MVNSDERKLAGGQRIDDLDPSDQITDAEDSIDVSSSGGKAPVSANQSVTRRLTEIFVEDGDEDLLLQRSDKEDGVFQWFRALDMQLMGACRADERLKPLLKLNTSTDVSEDPLIAHLSQHFEAAEVGILARCLCIPLVSIRVGRINKQGTLFCPTSTRGNLCIALLPTSDLRMSFNGDDGSIERLATLSTEAPCSDIEIQEIAADKSGRSFLIKTSDGVVSYFWCSEKSQLLGAELLRKMKDLLIKKPSLAKLTGISDSRLNCFAAHFRAYLTGSVLTSAQASGILSTTPSDNSIDSLEIHLPRSALGHQKSAHFQQCSSQANNIHSSSPSPESSSFKEDLRKSPTRSAAREKPRPSSEGYISDDNINNTSNSTDPSGPNCCQKDKHPESIGTSHSLALLNFLDILDKSTDLPRAGQDMQFPSSGLSSFSPHYCWCPPVASTMQSGIGSSQLPISSSESPSLPPLSSLLASGRPSILLTSKPLLNLADIPPIDFPNIPSEPLVRLPSSQQIPTFTPLICDPIVHIPVIDVCSSGQGYLVSGGPAMSTAIPPLNPNIVDPLLPKATESVVEKSARETLRMLISSSNQPNPPLLNVLPSVLTNDKENMLVVGSRGFYGGTQDVDAMSSMELVLSSDSGAIGKSCPWNDNSMDQNGSSSSFDYE